MAVTFSFTDTCKHYCKGNKYGFKNHLRSLIWFNVGGSVSLRILTTIKLSITNLVLAFRYSMFSGLFWNTSCLKYLHRKKSNSVGSGDLVGYLTAMEKFVLSIFKHLDKIVVVRHLADTIFSHGECLHRRES